MATSSAEPVEYALTEVYAALNKYTDQKIKRAVHFHDGDAFDSSLLAAEIIRIGMGVLQLNDKIESYEKRDKKNTRKA